MSRAPALSSLPPQRNDHDQFALSFARAIKGMGQAVISGGFSTDAPTDDPVARRIIQRSAVTVESTSTATQFRQTTIDALRALVGRTSCIAQLVPLMLPVSLEGTYGVQLPFIAPDADAVGFVLQGDPIPVRSGTFSAGVTLTTKKMATIITASKELFMQSSAEAVLKDVIARDLSLGWEKKLLSTDATTDAAPGGLLAGVTPIGAASDGGDAAMTTDLVALGAAVAAVSNDLFFIAGPKAGLTIQLRAPLFTTKYPLAITAALDDASVVCLSPSCVAIAGGSDPARIDVSEQAVLHMEDTSPTQLTPTATAAAFPVRSLFQTATLAVRLRADVNWALRSADAIAVVNDVSWVS